MEEKDVILDGRTRLETQEGAIREIYERLHAKCASYAALSERPFAGLLSGGWDSRLLASIFADQRALRTTFTTQQRTRVQKRLVSEKRIARDVARFLDVENVFVAPIYRTPATAAGRARALDYTTWFQDWAFALTESLPRDHYVFVDGLLGDILLRALHVSPPLRACVVSGARDAAVNYLHSRYVRGFNTYTRGLDAWKSMIRSELLDEFSDALMSELSREIHSISHEDFVTMFFIKNRTRRSIRSLPLLLFETKGAVILPFCDWELSQKALSIPFDYRASHALYRGLLERSKPGLSAIVSTNAADLSGLEPYLVEPGDYGLGVRNSRVGAAAAGAAAHREIPGGREKDDLPWAREAVRNPPSSLLDMLAPETSRAIKTGDIEKLRRLTFFLEKILTLDGYFSRSSNLS